MSSDPLDGGHGGGGGGGSGLRMNMDRRQRLAIERDWRDVNWRSRSAIVADKVGRARRANLMADIERKLAPDYAPPRKSQRRPPPLPPAGASSGGGSLQVLMAGKPAFSPRCQQAQQPDGIAELAEANAVAGLDAEAEEEEEEAKAEEAINGCDLVAEETSREKEEELDRPKPPAILASQGAVRLAPVGVKEPRQPVPPPPPPPPKKKRCKTPQQQQQQKGMPTGRSLDAAADMDAGKETVKSEEALLEEARLLAQLTRREPSTMAQQQQQQEATSATAEQEDPEEQKKPSELAPRTINQILGSMKETGGKLPPTVADRQIEQLMRRLAERRGKEFRGFEDDEEEAAEANAEDGKSSGRDTEVEKNEEETMREAAGEAGVDEAKESGTSVGPESRQAELLLAELEEETRKAEDQPTDLRLESLEDRLSTARSGMRTGRSSVPSARTPFMTDREVLELSRLPADVSVTDIVNVRGRPPAVRQSTATATTTTKKQTAAAARRQEAAADQSARGEPAEAMMPTSKPSVHSLCLLDDADWKRTEPEERRERKERHLLTRLPAAELPALTPDLPAQPDDLNATADSEAAAVDRIMREIDNYEAWQKRALEALQQLGEDGQPPDAPMQLAGTRVEFLSQRARRADMWETPPPRIQATPEKVRAALFRQYHSAAPFSTAAGAGATATDDSSIVGRGPTSRLSTNIGTVAPDGNNATGLAATDAAADAAAANSVDQTSGGVMALEDGVVDEGVLTRMRLQKRLSRSIERLSSQYKNDGGVESFFGLRSSRSLPNVHLDEEENLVLNLDYNAIEKELQMQSQLMAEEEKLAKLRELEHTSGEEQQEQQQQEQQQGQQMSGRPSADDEAPGEAAAGTEEARSRTQGKLSIKEHKPTPAELALAAGRKYVILPRQKQQQHQQQKKKKGRVIMARIDALERFLNEPANQLERRESIDTIKKPPELQLRVPKHIRSTRRHSLPLNLVQDFPAWASERGYREDADPRDWITVVWDRWFDEVYPPTPRADADNDNRNGQQGVVDAVGNTKSMPAPGRNNSKIAEGDKAEEEEDEDAASAADRELLRDPEFARVRRDSDSSDSDAEGGRGASEHPVELPERIPPALEEIPPADRAAAADILSQEVDRLTRDIEEAERQGHRPSAFQLCRRGALRRKLGYLRGACEDLDRCISQEPKYLDAYWHRHLLKVLEQRLSSALDDLNVLLKHAKDHASAYKARAEIHRKKNDVTMAIINYGQAIKLNPNDADCYYKRAGLYEKRGEMRLALEDYSMASKLNPEKTDALFKHGLYYFQNEQWQFAINDFTELLTRNPKDSRAYTYIGRSYAKLQQMIPAVQAFSSAVHLNPYNWIAFYHRGRLLRRAQPEKALRDLSISVMLNEDVDNAMAFLYRGILYCEMGRPEDAIPDFETLVRLRQDIPCAHVNLGLVYHHTDRPGLAIRHYSAAINVDPTYVRAVRCRVDAFVAMREYHNALLDITRCIHMNPLDPSFYMVRGEILLKMGNLDMAAFCVRHSAAMNQGRRTEEGASATQRALVLSFLGQFDEAIRVLREEAKVRPNKDILFLLGRTEMKAKRFADAAESLQECLEILKPWGGGNKKIIWPKEAAQVHYLIGDCHTALKNYGPGLESYTAALAIDPGFADGYYHRGLCRILMKQAKGVQDLNQALALNPAMYQVYLSRAAYYASEGRHSKAILNCNEALRLQPQCVRALLYRGSIKCRIRAHSLAIDDLTRAVAIDQACALAYFNRAVCYAESRQQESALRDYGTVLMLDDRRLRYRTLVNRGLLYLDCADPENALVDFLLAVQERPNDERLHHAIGTSYHRLRRLPQAVRAFSRALDANPAFLDACIGRGNCYLDFGSPRGLQFARRDYERVLAEEPASLAARINLAFSLQMESRMQAAWDQLSQAIEHQPGAAKPWECRAVISLQMGNIAGALADANQAVRLQPSSAECLVTRGVVQQCSGDRVSAMRDYQRALLAGPACPLAHYNAANVYLQQRQYHQARSHYDACIRLNPLDEGAYNNRALARGLLRDLDGALEDASRAIELSPHMAHAYYNRAKLAVRAGDLEAAEADYTVALRIQPDDPVLLKSRADCLGKLGRRQEAIDDYKRAVLVSDR